MSKLKVKILNKKNIKLILISGIVVCVVIVGVGMMTKEDVIQADNSIRVETAVVNSGQLNMKNSYIAKTEATDSISVTSKINGEVLKLNVKEGSNIKTGDVLFSLDSRNAQLGLKQAENGYSQTLVGQEQGILNANTAILNANAGYNLTNLGKEQALFNQDLSTKNSKIGLDLLDANKKQALDQAKMQLENTKNTYDELLLTKSQSIENAENALDRARDARDDISDLKSSMNSLKDLIMLKEIELADVESQIAAQENNAVVINDENQLETVLEKPTLNTNNDLNIKQNQFQIKENAVDNLNDLNIEKPSVLAFIKKESLASLYSRKSLLTSEIATLRGQYNSLNSQYSSGLIQTKNAEDMAEDALENTRDTFDLKIKNTKDSIKLLEKSIDNMEDTFKVQIEQAELGFNSQADIKSFIDQTYNAQIEQALIGINSANNSKHLLDKNYDSQVSNAQIGIDKAKLALENYTIKAPIPGTVSNVTIKEHTMVSPSLVTMIINNKDSISITFSVSSKVRNNIKVGDAIEVEAKNSEEAIITELSEMANKDNGLFQVKAVICNKNTTILPGENITVKLVTEKYNEKIVIPYDAVFFNGDKAYVYTVSGNTAKKTEIVVGEYNEDSIVVKEGLKKEDEIITSWAATLRNDAPIKIINDKTKSTSKEDNK